MNKVITVTGGKGGVGKTFVTVNLASVLARLKRKRVLIVDIDVSNPCVSTLIKSSVEIREPIKVFRPKLLDEKCVLCGECVRHCPVHALLLIPRKKLIFIETLCEGCAICLYVCPVQAITEGERTVGWINVTSERNLTRVIYGELVPGNRQEGEVMERTLEFSKRYWDNYDYVIIDTPPGTGKGIMRAIEESDLILSVTEPTRLGLHDLKKLHSLVKKVGKYEIVVLNKYGIPYGDYGEIENFVNSEGLKVYKIPYNDLAIRSYFEGKSMLEYGMKYETLKGFREIANDILL